MFKFHISCISRFQIIPIVNVLNFLQMKQDLPFGYIWFNTIKTWVVSLIYRGVIGYNFPWQNIAFISLKISQ